MTCGRTAVEADRAGPRVRRGVHAHHPFSCRSSPVRLEPRDYPGFVADDVDANGKCLLMRKVLSCR